MLCLKIHYLLAKLLIKIFWSKLWGYLCYTGGGCVLLLLPLRKETRFKRHKVIFSRPRAIEWLRL